MAEMAKKINNPRFSNSFDFLVMMNLEVNKPLFTDWIIDELKPKDFVISMFKLFDGKSDPMDHIFHFQKKMAIETNNEAILCKLFSTTLSGPTLAWFRQLLEKSVDNFDDFGQLFVKQYNSNMQQQKTMANLHHLVQNEDETPQ